MQFLDKLSPYAHWLMRLTLAGAFLWHGITKFTAEGGIGTFATMFQLPFALGLAAAISEIAGGGFILLGGLIKKSLITRLGGLFIATVMIGAIITVKIKMGWPAMEIDLLYLSVSLFFVLTGNKYSESEK